MIQSSFDGSCYVLNRNPQTGFSVVLALSIPVMLPTFCFGFPKQISDSCLFGIIVTQSDFGGIGVACWVLVPNFAGKNPVEALTLLGQKIPQNAFLRRESRVVGPTS